MDLVERDRIPVARFVGAAFEQLLVVRVLVLFVKAGGEAEISKLDMATSIE